MIYFVLAARYRKKWAANKEIRSKLVKFFLSKGCSAMQADKDGYLPVMRLMQQHENLLKRKDYELIRLLLETMLEECQGNGEYKVEKGKTALLNAWADNVSFYHIDEERKVFDIICEITQKLKSG